MYSRLYDEFLMRRDSLQVYEGGKLIFASTKDRLLPLLEYIDKLAPRHQQVVIFDKIVGNAAALLCVKANCRQVYSPLGSHLAVNTLKKYGIKHRISEIIPHIKRPDREDMCPMEKLSLDKDPEEFYRAVGGAAL